MWTVIYVAHDEAEAIVIKNLLCDEGFLVKLRNMGKENDEMYEILVPQSEADEAHSVLDQKY